MDANNVKRVLIVGAGTMGHAIAQVFAHHGIEVGLVDTDRSILERALKQAAANLRVLADYGKVVPEEIPRILERIHATTDLKEAAQGGVDFALEAVFEVPELKREIFQRLEDICSSETVLASNTSSLDIFEIVGLNNPKRLVVAHWFAPPHIIPLVEVVPGPKTSHGALTFTARLMARVGKRPVVIKQFMPGFIVNRIQLAMINSALEILENGWATPEEIDTALKTSLGIRLPIVGVAQSMDFTGLRLLHDIQRASGRESGLIAEKVKKGHLGVSTSRGLYDYGGRSEQEILRKRDELYLKMLHHLENIGAFEAL